MDTHYAIVQKRSQNLKWAVYDPIAFHNFEVSWGAWNQSFKIYGFICDAIFCICMYAHKTISNEA